MDAAQIAAGLERSKKTSDGFEACCPAHNDKTPSLTITENEDGKVLVHCHAGCDQKDVIQALKEKNLWPEPKPKTKAKKKIVATYNYVSEDGELVFQVVRFEPKDFRQRRPDGSDWIWNLKGITRIPYNLPEVLNTNKAVLIVEGEKDVENLRKIGVVATTCCGGGGKWQTSYNKYFKKKKVIIVPDNDQTGEEHAESVATSLQGIADSVKIVHLPDLGNKQDISDWLSKGNAKSDLVELVKAAQEYKPAPAPTQSQLPQEHPTNADAPDTNDWRNALIQNDKGDLLASSISNAQTVLAHHGQMQGVLAYNEFSHEVELLRDPPWGGEPAPRSLDDVDAIRCAGWLEHYGLKQSVSNAHMAMVSAAHKNRYNPLQDYLNGLSWHGVEWAETWMQTFLGVEDTPYSRAIGKRFLVGAVARAMDPGCKMDTMMILEGKQGLKKSSAIAALFGENWFTDELDDLGSKDAAMQVQGVWCVEMSELTTLSRSEANRAKEFISRQKDRFRAPYGRTLVTAKRQCVFIGTVNPEGGYLKDATGARRYWPIQCGPIDIDGLVSARDQLWAEAVQLYKNGEQWWLTKEEETAAGYEQEDRYESDPWEERVSRFVEHHNNISIPYIMEHCLDLDASKQTQAAQNRISKILISQGRARVQKRVDGRRTWVYSKDESDLLNTRR